MAHWRSGAPQRWEVDLARGGAALRPPRRGQVEPMRLNSTAAFLIAAIELPAAPARAEARRYQLDVDVSRVVIQVGKAGLFGIAGHELEVVAPIQHGSISADPDHIGAASVDVTFDAAALRLTGEREPAGEVAAVQRTMLGPECLDVARFPGIHFASTGVTGLGRQPDGHRIAVRGALTLHGVTRSITVPARIEFKSDTIKASGTVTIRPKDFGIEPISRNGVVNVKDELDLEWRLVAPAGGSSPRSGAGPKRWFR
jgi:polyisoprenoid-binding protein YceI